MDKPTFETLGLSPEILKAVSALGFEEAAPIQAATIPLLMSGKDVVGQSQTGSGKTAAFAIPAIEGVDANLAAVQVLILCPTRELATQVADEVHKLTAFKRGIHSVPIYGGASYDRQFYELKKGVQIVIGTPGRLIDHLERGTLILNALKMVILDEADRMLDMGFRDDIQRLLDAMPKERQTVFFSATMSREIKDLIGRHSRNPEMVKIEQKTLEAPAIEQWYYEAHSRNKLETLIRLVDYHGFKLGIIFCNTQRMVDELADALIAQGFSADRLHGGIAQAQRTRVMNKFKKAEFEFLVATDVAARGIDVEDLELVVNYDLPYDAEDYVHRIGRTGRAGRRGMAITFVSGRDIYKLQHIERYTKAKIQRGKTPSVGEVVEKRTDALLDRVRGVLDAGQFKVQSGLVDRMLEEGFNSTDLAAGLFHLLSGGETKVAPRAEAAPPVRVDREDDEADREFTRREAPRRERDRADSGPNLRKPARGALWVSLNVGKADGFGPRQIVDAISDGGGIPANRVGSIELADNESFAQVPEDFAKGLSPMGNTLSSGGRDISIRLVSAKGGPSKSGPGKFRTGKPRPGKFGSDKRGPSHREGEHSGPAQHFGKPHRGNKR
jgi:ATP-dependent RNA helicase DeaD